MDQALRRHKLFLAAVRCLEVVGNIRKPERNKHELRQAQLQSPMPLALLKEKTFVELEAAIKTLRAEWQVEQGEDGDEEGGAEKEDLET